MTQADVDTAVNQVINNFTGQRIAMPNGQYAGECTAPITHYLQYLELPWNLSMQNNRADGWGVNPPYQLQPYFSFENFQRGKAYPRGTILMWDSPHIAIVLADNGGDNVVVCFEQNADPDGAPCGTHNRTLNTSGRTCTYAMVPIVVSPLPPAFTTESITPKWVQINKQTNRYDLRYRDINEMANNPVGPAYKDDKFTVVTIAKHIDDQQYYMAADSDVTGWNVNDCDDYLEPAPLPPEPAPYVFPAAPLPYPIDTTPYMILADIPYFSNYIDAQNHVNGKGELAKESTYFKYKELGGMVSLTSDITASQSIWINPGDNVVAPVAPPAESVFVGPRENTVTPPIVETPKPVVSAPVITKPVVSTDSADKIRASYHTLFPDGAPALYKIKKNVVVYDQMKFGKEKPLTAGKDILIYGYFTKNGQKYLRPILPSDTTKYYWYGIPCDDINKGTPFLDNEWDASMKIKYGVELVYDKTMQSIDGFFRPIKKALINKLTKKK